MYKTCLDICHRHGLILSPMFLAKKKKQNRDISARMNRATSQIHYKAMVVN